MGPFVMRQTRKTAGAISGAGSTDRTQFIPSSPLFGATPQDRAQPISVPTIMAAPGGPFQPSNATPHTPHQTTPTDKLHSESRSSKVASTKMTIDTSNEKQRIEELFTASQQRNNAQLKQVTEQIGDHKTAGPSTL